MIEGSCLCGSVRYQVALLEDKVFNCHCQYCRKAHGADYVTMVIADAGTLKITDDKNVLKEHRNDIGGYRAFCSFCGTRLMNYALDKNTYFSITLSTVDSEHSLAPVAHVNTESKAAWCTPYDGIPEFLTIPEGIV